MNAFFGDLGQLSPAEMPWAPLADVTENDDAYVIHVELPGVNKDQVDVQLQDRELVITGEIKEESENGGRRHRSSRRTGGFEYRTYLPGDVKADAVSAQLTDGVLTVTVPKSEAAKPRRIEITG
jgi:HSP20 family protein